MNYLNIVQWYFESGVQYFIAIFEPNSIFYIDILNLDSKFYSGILDPVSIFYSSILNWDSIFYRDILSWIQYFTAIFWIRIQYFFEFKITYDSGMCIKGRYQFIFWSWYYCDRKQHGGWSVWERKRSELDQQVPLLKKKLNIWGKGGLNNHGYDTIAASLAL